MAEAQQGSAPIGELDLCLLPLPVDAATLARLTGEQCLHCGGRESLSPARLEYTTDGKGGLYGWVAAACPRHRRGRT
jgi:hypothetical protein